MSSRRGKLPPLRCRREEGQGFADKQIVGRQFIRGNFVKNSLVKENEILATPGQARGVHRIHQKKEKIGLRERMV